MINCMPALEDSFTVPTLPLIITERVASSPEFLTLLGPQHLFVSIDNIFLVLETVLSIEVQVVFGSLAAPGFQVDQHGRERLKHPVAAKALLIPRQVHT